MREELPVVVRTNGAEDLRPGALLAGREWVVLALTVETKRVYGDILQLLRCTAQAVLQVSSRRWFKVERKIIY